MTNIGKIYEMLHKTPRYFIVMMEEKAVKVTDKLKIHFIIFCDAPRDVSDMSLSFLPKQSHAVR